MRVRYFDVRDHDPAKTGREMDEFMSGLRQLFVDGYLMCPPTEKPRDKTWGWSRARRR